MNFKEIQLVGFKSFADKTSIKFEDGVTCIVGPNGCGKSNVADAIRWVLGEQSAKTMRGTSMQDVIFNGTQKRKSLSFCEVTLVFDNTNKLFDIEYQEVAMTRRLYRNGESEYLLNKQPCRLKDIVALLHEVGIGKEGYSIIGQGKIEQIMNAKPEDRRMIFEEATGIMVFKSRKMEIERRLQNSFDDLNLYTQRMAEVERQLSPLQKSAENTRKYNEITENLKYHEINTFVYKSANAVDSKQKIQDKLDSTNHAISESKARMDKIAETFNTSYVKMSEADEKLQKLNEKLLQYTVGLEKKNSEAKIMKERANYYISQQTNCENDIKANSQRIEQIKNEKEKLSNDILSTKEQITSCKKDGEKLLVKIQDLDSQIFEYEVLNDESQRQVISNIENLSSIRQNLGSINAKKDAISERVNEIHLTIDKLNEKIVGIKSAIEKCREKQRELKTLLDGEKSVFEQKYANIEEINGKAESYVEKLFDCNAKISALKDNYKFYLGIKEGYDGYKISVKRLLSESQQNKELSRRMKGVIADIVKTEQKYETAIETAFGGAMQNIVTATSDDARYLIEYLKQAKFGIVTFLPVANLRPNYNNESVKKALKERGALGLATDLVKYDSYFENVIFNLLGNTLICDTIVSATEISKKYPHAFKIVTLDGDIVSTSGSMTGGSRRADSGSLLSNERKLQETLEIIEKREKEVLELKEQKQKAEILKQKANEEIESLRIKYQDAKTLMAGLIEKEQALSNALVDTEKELSAYSGILNTSKDKLKDLDSEITTSSEGEQKINELKSQSAQEVEKNKQAYEKTKKERETTFAEYNALQIKITSLNSLIESDNQNILRLTAESDSLTAKIKESNENLNNLMATIIDLEEMAEKAALSNEEQNIVNDLRKQIDLLSADKESLNRLVENLTKEREQTQNQIDEFSNKRYSQELSLSKIDSDLKFLEERIGEEYGVTLEQCIDMRDVNYDIVISKSEIFKLKHQQSALGSVNPNAIAEYEELDLHYQEMLTQKEDLDKGISDLKGVLEELKTEMQKQFDEGFNTINTNFKQVFKELFGGGNAELQMDYTECDDPLNAGVEIVACPPGKKLTKISLLSGGERALTAIAILFAILKLRPMPFCVLDEIEAALDEANVAKYASYLKKFAQSTQFIVISHRKPTMEQADALFGVTMEEKGVSKIVSVKFSEVEEQLGGDTVA